MAHQDVKDITISSLRLSSRDLGLFLKYQKLENRTFRPSQVVSLIIETMKDSILSADAELMQEYIDSPKSLHKIFKKVTSSKQVNLKKLSIKKNDETDKELLEVLSNNKTVPNIDEMLGEL